MVSWSPSPPLIKGIDGIESRPPKQVNYSPLNGISDIKIEQMEKEEKQIFEKNTIIGHIMNKENKVKNNGKFIFGINQGKKKTK